MDNRVINTALFYRIECVFSFRLFRCYDSASAVGVGGDAMPPYVKTTAPPYYYYLLKFLYSRNNPILLALSIIQSPYYYYLRTHHSSNSIGVIANPTSIGYRQTVGGLAGYPS